MKKIANKQEKWVKNIFFTPKPIFPPPKMVTDSSSSVESSQEWMKKLYKNCEELNIERDSERWLA